MKLVSIPSGVGVMLDERQFVRLERHAPDLPRSLRGLLEAGSEALDEARRITSHAAPDGSIDDDDGTLLPVIPDPPSIWCVGVNYVAHREETGRDPSSYPVLFLRIAASQVGHLQPMVKPRASDQLDYEGELAVILGRGGRHIETADAMSHVAGYACYNDGSVRDWQRHTSQFGPGKNFEATGGFGPWMVTADEVPNPYEQTLVTRVSGEEMQRTRIDRMIFKIEELIHYLSTIYTLRPGDVISTGTPAGVGSKRIPPRFLRPGDEVEVDITGVGILKNLVTAESE